VFRAVHVDCFTIVSAEFLMMKTMNRTRVEAMLKGDEVCVLEGIRERERRE
jgi:hypothetical protein